LNFCINTLYANVIARNVGCKAGESAVDNDANTNKCSDIIEK